MLCPFNTWLNETGAGNATRCRPCPATGVQCFRGDVLSVERGYYLATAYDSRTYLCASRSACAGGDFAFADASCDTGHRGVLCGECANAYYRAQRQCLPCAVDTDANDAKRETAILIAVISIATPALILLYLQPPHCNMRCISIALKSTIARQMAEKLVTASTLAKLIIAYCQCLGALNRVPDVHWPDLFVSFMEVLDRIFSIELFSVVPAECVTGRLGFYIELLATQLLPITMCLLVIFIVALHRKIALCYGWRLSDRTPGWGGFRAALHHPRVYKLLTWGALFIYPTLARKPLAVFDCMEAPGVAVLRDDPAEACFEGQWFWWAAFASAGILLHGLGLPLIAFVLASRCRDGESDARERVSLLVDSYRTHFWACESLTLVYKLVLTGLMPLLPDTRLQVWLGVMGNLAAWAAIIQCVPFRSKFCNVVAATVLLQLMLSYISAFLFLGDANVGVVEMRQWPGVVLVVLNSTCFVVLAVGVGAGIWRTYRTAAEKRLRFALSHEPVPAPQLLLPVPGAQRLRFHLFLSHVWATGQVCAWT